MSKINKVKCQKSIRSNVKCQKSIGLILTERTSGVPPVILILGSTWPFGNLTLITSGPRKVRGLKNEAYGTERQPGRALYI